MPGSDVRLPASTSISAGKRRRHRAQSLDYYGPAEGACLLRAGPDRQRKLHSSV